VVLLPFSPPELDRFPPSPGDRFGLPQRPDPWTEGNGEDLPDASPRLPPFLAEYFRQRAEQAAAPPSQDEHGDANLRLTALYAISHLHKKYLENKSDHEVQRHILRLVGDIFDRHPNLGDWLNWPAMQAEQLDEQMALRDLASLAVEQGFSKWLRERINHCHDEAVRADVLSCLEGAEQTRHQAVRDLLQSHPDLTQHYQELQSPQTEGETRGE